MDRVLKRREIVLKTRAKRTVEIMRNGRDGRRGLGV